MIKTSEKNGFVALMSAVIISAVIMALLFSGNLSTFYSRFDTLDSEYKQVAANLAEACLNVVLERVAEDSDYLGNETLPLGSDDQGRSQNCTIGALSPAPPRSKGTNVTIPAQGSYVNTFSNFKVAVSLSDLSIVSWIEATST